MANKKPTKKERDQQITYLTHQVHQLNLVFGAYVKYKGDETDFQKHLVDLNAKLKEEENAAKNDNKSNDKSDS